jgi:mannose-1-phosphate guanylyltransferase/mannose-6-phosphate isomerase
VHSVESGLSAAEQGSLVIFGVEPDCPHTGYGYVETEPSNSVDLGVRCFVEKPSLTLAEEYFKTGGYLWNAGIFLYKSKTMLELMEKHAPTMLECCRKALDGATEDIGFLRLSDAYASAPSLSVDYAIAEKTDQLRCVPPDSDWSDVGSWSAVWNLRTKDSAGNVTHGEGEILIADTRNSYAYSERGCVALVGLENVVVVATEDAVLVTSKAHAESVRSIVARLNGNGCALTVSHNRVYRPWGWYQTLNRGDRYQVKCIMVKPGGKLSLQSHYHRSEHWVVVKGTLEVTQGDTVKLLSENESTFIPIGKQHRLANPGKIPAFLIEVQSGAYLDEDDIIRFEDVYGRAVGE